MSASINIDPKGILVDALKSEPEKFQVSNLILKNQKSLRAVFELSALRSALLEFAKNSEIGIQLLPKPPQQPNLDNLTPEEIEELQTEYMQLKRMYEDQKIAYLMHVPSSDYLMIQQYLAKYENTLYATPAVKGNRFYAFTKNTEQQEGGLLGFLKNRQGGAQQQ